MIIISMSSNVDLHDYYLNGGVPVDIAENLKDFLQEHEDLSYEEVLLQQASVYESYQERGKNTIVDNDDDHNSDLSHYSEDEGESSRGESENISQEALDEAFARSLQELGEEFDEFFISEFNSNASGETESPIATPTAHAASPDSRQEDIDPDNMRYEELLHLTETVGVENRGLSTAQISRLPNSIYRSKMFSKNKEENCVICQMNFNFGERVITLPCSHQYHTKCIAEWLKLKKNCPICQKEVV